MQNQKLLDLLLFFKKHKKLIIPIAILLVFTPLFHIIEISGTGFYIVTAIISLGSLLILGSSLIFLVLLSTQYKKGWFFYSLLVIFYPIYFFGPMFTDIYDITETGVIGLGMMIVLVPFYLTFSLVLWIVMKGIKSIIIKRRIKNKIRQKTEVNLN